MATTTFSSGVPQRISTRRCATKVKKDYHIPLLCDIWHLPGGGVGEACEIHRRRNSATLTNWLCLVFGGPAVCGAPPKDIKLYYQSKGIAQRHCHKASMSGGQIETEYIPQSQIDRVCSVQLDRLSTFCTVRYVDRVHSVQ